MKDRECPNCGAPVQKKGKNCEHCGSRLRISSNPPDGGTTEKDEFDMEDTWKDAQKQIYRRNVKVIVAIGVIVAVLLVVAYLLGFRIFPGG